MAKILGNGFEYDTDTRKVSFRAVQCWNCKGAGIVERGISCPKNWQTVRKYGGKCPDCGSKNQHNHKLIGSHEIVCDTCNGTGVDKNNNYDNLDLSVLVDYIKVSVIDNAQRRMTFNESYLGFGIVAGCTDYGAYRERANKMGGDLVAYFTAKMKEDFARRFTQAGNLVSKDGYLATDLVIFTASSGWSAVSTGEILPQFAKMGVR